MQQVSYCCDYDCNQKVKKLRKLTKLLGLKLNSKKLLCKTLNSRMNSIEYRTEYNLKGQKVKWKCTNVRRQVCTGLCK